MVHDHGLSWVVEAYVEQLAISKFKATCLAVLDRVNRTGQPVLITRFGRPVAEVVPPSPPARPERWLGCMRSTLRITG
ncbi:MAG: type II toxin-antitoxin system Phd/YefM family antitoxin, partial [Acidobacteria bacterium]|nr:type II toxin-antitoxin system Phd/YefM family antitoxin [Acidobacteriota bacterium]